MNILVAEDESQKLSHIIDFVEEIFPEASIRVAKSVRSAIDEVEESTPDLILLDMSLPTFDVGPGETGGRPQGFGGVEVLRQMDFLDTTCNVFVVTAYEGFDDGNRAVNLSGLTDELRAEHPSTFRGAVYYGGLGGIWRDELIQMLKESGYRVGK